MGDAAIFVLLNLVSSAWHVHIHECHPLGGERLSSFKMYFKVTKKIKNLFQCLASVLLALRLLLLYSVCRGRWVTHNLLGAQQDIFSQLEFQSAHGKCIIRPIYYEHIRICMPEWCCLMPVKWQHAMGFVLTKNNGTPRRWNVPAASQTVSSLCHFKERELLMRVPPPFPYLLRRNTWGYYMGGVGVCVCLDWWEACLSEQVLFLIVCFAWKVASWEVSDLPETDCWPCPSLGEPWIVSDSSSLAWTKNWV